MNRTDAVSKKCLYDWFKRFLEEKEIMDDEPRSDRFSTSVTTIQATYAGVTDAVKQSPAAFKMNNGGKLINIASKTSSKV